MDEFDLDLIHKAYAVALDFDTPEDRAKALKISVERFQDLQATWTPFANAIAAAGQRKALNGISEFIDPETRKSWELITGTDAPEKQAALIAFANGAEVTRQKIFMQACIETYFDVTRVCKILGIGKKTLDNWNRSSEFREMLESVNWAKRNFVESAMMKLVAQGSERATIEANKSLNREVYGDRLTVDGQINHAVAVVSVDALDLPLETRLMILEATRKAGLTDSDGLFIDDRTTDLK
ncbi:MAG: hypothetical protein ACK57V_09455 [Pirellula sp.]